jgi:glycine cleavage system aminomethyltransferase T
VFSPTLNQNIALGYVRREFEIPDQELTVELPAGTARAQVCPLPFI